MKVFSAFLLLVPLTMTCWSACVPAFASIPEVQNLHKRADNLTGRNDYSGALKLLRQSLKIDPGHFETREAINQACREHSFHLQLHGDMGGALRQLQLALYVSPQSWRTKRELAQLISAMRHDPANWKTHHKLAQEAHRKGEFISAVVQGRLALSLNDAEVVRQPLAEAITARNRDALYYKELDMRKPDLYPPLDFLLAKAAECADKRYFGFAGNFVDAAVATAPDAPRVLKLIADVESAENNYIAKLKSEAVESERSGDHSSAKTAYREILKLRRDDECSMQGYERLRSTPSPSPTKRLTAYVELSEKTIKANWHPLKSSQSDSTTTVFRINPDGKVCDILVANLFIDEKIAQPCVSAIETATLTPPPGQKAPITLKFTFDYNVYYGARR